MARARNLKPGFFSNEILAECQPLTRILFEGLWCLADREGRLEDRPMKIKTAVLPYDNCDIDKLLNELASKQEQDGNPAFIIRYEVEGKRYIQVLNFGRHQNPHIKESASTIPAPDLQHTSIVLAPDKHGTCPAESLLLNPLTLNPLTESLNPQSPGGDVCESPAGELSGEEPQSPPESSKRNDYDPRFEEAWQEYPRHDDKKVAYRCWLKLIKDGESPENITLSCKNYRERNPGKDKQFYKMLKTFLGRDRPYTEYLTNPEEDPPKKTTKEIFSGLFGDECKVVGFDDDST